MISFVVPAYNEEPLIGGCLQAIHAAAESLGQPYEIVVADDDSSDGTRRVAESKGARIIRVSNRQIARTRNAGARAATGEILVFVDADTLVTNAAVQAANRALQSGAVGGGTEIQFEGRIPLYARLLLPLFVLYFRVARFAAGCFVFCSRPAFEAVGGFDERLFGGEEVALSRALKRQGRFVILREPVTTSGRKLRAHSGWEVLRLLGALALRGPGLVRTREGMAIWYHHRRQDPDQPG
jgi:glycosyltransferase involved in cell wall biosynthesis